MYLVLGATMTPLGRWILLAAIGLAAALPARSQDKPKKTELTSRIDQILESKWSKANTAPVADDGEFLRRLSIDLRGMPPGEDEARAFMSNPGATKRLEKIEEYLAGPEYPQLWSRIWADIMFPNFRDIYVQSGKNLVRGTSNRMTKELLKWLSDHVAKDTPLPRMIAELLEAYGKSEENPLILYKLSFYNGGGDAPLEFADGFSKAWLSVRVSCARCHDHPFDQWKQEHFYGLAAFFARQRVKHFGGRKNDECDEVELWEDKTGDMSMPDTGRMMPPTYLYGGRAGTNEGRMTSLAKLVIMDPVRQLPRSTANRVWSILMGRGLVNPVDDFNRKNKVMYPDLLEAMTKDFAGHAFSIKHLIRGICASKAYQLSSGRDAETATEDFSRHVTRQMRTEQLLNSLVVATRGPEPVQKRADGYKGLWDGFAGQLGLIYGPGVPYNEVTQLPGNTRQALMMRNSELVNRMLKNGGGVLSKICGDPEPAERKIERLFVAILTRTPREGELKRWTDYVKERGGGPEAFEDVAWTLINTSEFSTRH